MSKPIAAVCALLVCGYPLSLGAATWAVYAADLRREPGKSLGCNPDMGGRDVGRINVMSAVCLGERPNVICATAEWEADNRRFWKDQGPTA